MVSIRLQTGVFLLTKIYKNLTLEKRGVRLGCLSDCRLGMCGEKGRHLRHGQNRRHFLIIALSWGYHLTELHDNESNCSLPETFSKIVQSALSEKNAR